jgi:acyl carrier protein
MTVIGLSQNQQTRTANGGSVDIEKMRALIAKNLDIDVRRVTEDAHLIRDLGADWLDRLELIILVEEISGVEIADDEADLIEVVGDLILYIDKRRNATRSAPRGRGDNPAGTQRLPAL